MPAPPWLQNVLVAVGTTGIKALRHGVREGAANAIDSVLEDVQVFTDEVSQHVRRSRKNWRKKRSPAEPKASKPRRSTQDQPEVIEATIVDEEE